jgi:hypothetical protein
LSREADQGCGRHEGPGVQGQAANGAGTGVFGNGPDGSVGVRGENAVGSRGFLAGTDPIFSQRAGVYGQSDQQGVIGLTTGPNGTGVFGGSTALHGGSGTGIRGETFGGIGVQGTSFGGGVAVEGRSLDSNGNIDPRGTAGNFIGSVTVTENINAKDVFVTGGDCAEDFDIADLAGVDPGTVMVIDDVGTLRPCQIAYDKKATGVIAGAGNHRPGIILDKSRQSPIDFPSHCSGRSIARWTRSTGQFGRAIF